MQMSKQYSVPRLLQRTMTVIVVSWCAFLSVACGNGECPPITSDHPVHRAGVVKKDGTPEPKPTPTNEIRVYYDGVHGARHLFDRDNRRYRTDYHTVSGWYRFMDAIRTAGYQLHTETYACFDAESLAPYNVFIVGEQTYHARFMTTGERAALVEWVRNGGGLFITAEHTNAHFMGDIFNLITEEMPVKARFDGICDTENSHRSSPSWTTLHPDPKKPHPVIEGVRDYSFYNGCSLDTEFGVLFSSAKGSWSDYYRPEKGIVHNGNKKKDDGELEGPLAGVAAFEFGKGRVVVIGDHNALTNTSLYRNDHHRFAMNAIRWLAKAEDQKALVDFEYPDGVDFLIYTGARSELELHKKEDRGSYRTAYGFLSKEPQLRPWTSKRLRAGDDVIFLGAPRRKVSKKDLRTLDDALKAGKSVVWLATLNSISSEVAEQLQEHFGFKLYLGDQFDFRGTLPMEVHGSKEWTESIYRVFVNHRMHGVKVEGLEPVVQLSWGSQHIEDEQWERPEILIDLVSSKPVGKGTFYVIAPFDIFDDGGLRSLYAEGSDVIRQQMAELFLRTAKIAAKDKTVYAD
jgi:hypothetical protein